MSGRIGKWRARPWGRPWEAVPGIAAAADAVTEIGLSRGPCFGPCPVYSLQLARSGAARFDGKHFVDLIGPHQAEVAPEDFSVLALAICHLKFETLDAQYAVNYTDAASTSTWIRRAGRVIKVRDYGGAGPERLHAVEKLIDDAASELQWRPGGEQIGDVDDPRVSIDLETDDPTANSSDAPDGSAGPTVLEPTESGIVLAENATDEGKSSGNPEDDSIAGDLEPRADGKVYCCVTLGWVDPATAFEHRWDTSRSFEEYESERASSWEGVEPGP